MRLVLDTSVVVAGLRSPDGASRLWLEAALRGRFSLLLSVPLLLEYEAVLSRKDNLAASNLEKSEVGALLDAFCKLGEPVELQYLWRPMLRDPGDEMVLETAALGRADALLTFNIRDFAGSERWGISVEEPGPAWHHRKGNLK